MARRIIIFIYFLTGAAFILIEGNSAFLPLFLLKALLMPVLILLWLLSTTPAKGKQQPFLIAGLLFSWAGDIILELPFSGDIWFVAGLGAFLLAHVMYIVVFTGTAGENIILKKRLLWISPVVIYGIILFLILRNNLGEMRVPVLIYTIIILTMVASAISRFGKVNRYSYYLVLAGAILFTLSDSAIAINKFGHPFSYSSFLVMSTYIVAQFLIVTGLIRQNLSK